MKGHIMNIKKPALLTVLAILTACFAFYRFSTRNISSIGIIGSADGPTAVLISHSGGGRTYIYAIALIIIAFVAVRFILKK